MMVSKYFGIRLLIGLLILNSHVLILHTDGYLNFDQNDPTLELFLDYQFQDFNHNGLFEGIQVLITSDYLFDWEPRSVFDGFLIMQSDDPIIHLEQIIFNIPINRPSDWYTIRPDFHKNQFIGNVSINLSGQIHSLAGDIDAYFVIPSIPIDYRQFESSSGSLNILDEGFEFRDFDDDDRIDQVDVTLTVNTPPNSWISHHWFVNRSDGHIDGVYKDSRFYEAGVRTYTIQIPGYIFRDNDQFSYELNVWNSFLSASGIGLFSYPIYVSALEFNETYDGPYGSLLYNDLESVVITNRSNSSIFFQANSSIVNNGEPTTIYTPQTNLYDRGIYADTVVGSFQAHCCGAGDAVTGWDMESGRNRYLLEYELKIPTNNGTLPHGVYYFWAETGTPDEVNIIWIVSDTRITEYRIKEFGHNLRDILDQREPKLDMDFMTRLFESQLVSSVEIESIDLSDNLTSFEFNRSLAMTELDPSNTFASKSTDFTTYFEFRMLIMLIILSWKVRVGIKVRYNPRI